MIEWIKIHTNKITKQKRRKETKKKGKVKKKSFWMNGWSKNTDHLFCVTAISQLKKKRLTFKNRGTCRLVQFFFFLFPFAFIPILLLFLSLPAPYSSFAIYTFLLFSSSSFSYLHTHTYTKSMTINHDKPSILILGGTDFIGRHLVHYLISNQLASHIRVADKMLPQTAYLSKQHEQSFKLIEFKQANLVNPGMNPPPPLPSIRHTHTKENTCTHPPFFHLSLSFFF